MNQIVAEPAGRRPGGRPNLPSWTFIVTDAFDIGGSFRRVLFTTANIAELAYKPGQDFAFFLPLGNGEVGRRHYTVRSIDREKGEIAVDFFMHGATPGPEFARNAKAGDVVAAKGPRGRTVLREDADWHLFSGDETCLPAILHILETMPAGSRAFVFLEVRSEADIEEITSAADVTVEWVLRGDVPAGPNELILARLKTFELPEGQGQAYIIGETSNVRAQRHHLVSRGMTKDRIASEGYWRPGREGGHDHVDD
ncbi:siderophore-interacting protein [Rhizobiaceae bacterium BDR2-2]|uniref:Siderophore-interacting protein n=1 Tax=Ectorhizobium quercum TaxID=2965071 RepID=A0AAE3MYY3_9HYPH|nr:siderophore-interacting protein [Ectorhizobium quercum]MCX8996927.1 siderophore-interacting protein [Ectorhizobium quercum]